MDKLLLVLAGIFLGGVGLHAACLVCLRHFQIGQPIRSEGPKAHHAKQGTPTMGGLALLATFYGGAVLLLRSWSLDVQLALAFTGLYALIGFVDDVLKIVRKHNQGLSSLQKMVALLLAAGGLAWALDHFLYMHVLRELFHSPWLFYGWVLLVCSGTANAFNITDGLDGLAALCLIPVFLVLAFGCVEQNFMDLARLCILAAVACVCFLVFNWHPAKMFMGEAGILALGGLAAAVALMAGLEWVLLMAGAVCVAETLSVLAQVLYFKYSGGQRIFKMSPLHHHFELSGWSEARVVRVFGGLSWLCALLALMLLRRLLW